MENRTLARTAAALLLLSALLISGCSTPRRTANVPFQIGNTTVHAQVYQRPAPGPTYLNVHDDENTSVIAGKSVLAKTGGRLIELHHRGHRHVIFQLDGQTYRFDPNRIFSPVGVRATLERTKNYSDAAQRAVECFAHDFIERFALDREPVIIALHNTGGGGLSINSYLATGDKPTTASAVHVSTNRLPAISSTSPTAASSITSKSGTSTSRCKTTPTSPTTAQPRFTSHAKGFPTSMSKLTTIIWPNRSKCSASPARWWNILV